MVLIKSKCFNMKNRRLTQERNPVYAISNYLLLCLALIGCSSNQELIPDPKNITLFYGDTSISAGVLEDKTFSSVLADRVESVTFRVQYESKTLVTSSIC